MSLRDPEKLLHRRLLPFRVEGGGWGGELLQETRRQGWGLDRRAGVGHAGSRVWTLEKHCVWRDENLPLVKKQFKVILLLNMT